jgi:hypothetical protein
MSATRASAASVTRVIRHCMGLTELLTLDE